MVVNLWTRSRLARERRTVATMIAIYCRHHHDHGGRRLCDACAALGAYARQRLDRCVYGAAKPTCANCPIHCYRWEMGVAIREVMAFAGPRMLWSHPIQTVFHLLDGRRPAPQRRPRSRVA
jgi:hypothetical protein